MSGGGELKTSQRIVTAFPSTAEYSSSSGVRTTGARSAEFVKNSRSPVLLPHLLFIIFHSVLHAGCCGRAAVGEVYHKVTLRESAAIRGVFRVARLA